MRLLEETVQELKGEEVPPEIHASLNLGLDIRIPPDYIAKNPAAPSVQKHLGSAKKSRPQNCAKSSGIATALSRKMSQVLIQFSLLKSLAERLGVESVDRRQGLANIKFHPQSKIDPMKLMSVVQRSNGAQFTPAGVLKIPISAQEPAALITELKGKLEGLRTEQ